MLYVNMYIVVVLCALTASCTAFVIVQDSEYQEQQEQERHQGLVDALDDINGNSARTAAHLKELEEMTADSQHVMNETHDVLQGMYAVIENMHQHQQEMLSDGKEQLEFLGDMNATLREIADNPPSNDDVLRDLDELDSRLSKSQLHYRGKVTAVSEGARPPGKPLEVYDRAEAVSGGGFKFTVYNKIFFGKTGSIDNIHSWLYSCMEYSAPHVPMFHTTDVGDTLECSDYNIGVRPKIEELSTQSVEDVRDSLLSSLLLDAEFAEVYPDQVFEASQFSLGSGLLNQYRTDPDYPIDCRSECFACVPVRAVHDDHVTRPDGQSVSNVVINFLAYDMWTQDFCHMAYRDPWLRREDVRTEQDGQILDNVRYYPYIERDLTDVGNYDIPDCYDHDIKIMVIYNTRADENATIGHQTLLVPPNIPSPRAVWGELQDWFRMPCYYIWEFSKHKFGCMFEGYSNQLHGATMASAYAMFADTTVQIPYCDLNPGTELPLFVQLPDGYHGRAVPAAVCKGPGEDGRLIDVELPNMAMPDHIQGTIDTLEEIQSTIRQKISDVKNFLGRLERWFHSVHEAREAVDEVVNIFMGFMV